MKLITWLLHLYPGFKICLPIFALGVFTTVSSLPFVAIYIARRFDPLFKDKTEMLYTLGLNRLSRSSWYASVMLYYNWPWLKPRSKTLPYAIFKDYNLWQNATGFEKILACIHVIPGVIGLFAAIIFYAHHFIEVYFH